MLDGILVLKVWPPIFIYYFSLKKNIEIMKIMESV